MKPIRSPLMLQVGSWVISYSCQLEDMLMMRVAIVLGFDRINVRLGLWTNQAIDALIPNFEEATLTKAHMGLVPYQVPSHWSPHTCLFHFPGREPFTEEQIATLREEPEYFGHLFVLPAHFSAALSKFNIAENVPA